MKPEFEVSIHVGKPVEEVYEAVADAAILSRYFTTGGARGRMEKGETVSWDFADFPGRFDVEVIDAVKPERLVFLWDAQEGGKPAGYRTTVRFDFEPVDEGKRTKILISESGWSETDAGATASYGNCMGWSQMLCALKVWLEHGINLREGMYR